MELEKRILAILEKIRPEYDFAQSNDYIEDGYLDSFDMITLVSDLENEFSIIVDGLDIIPENFMNTETISQVIRKNGGEV